MLKYIIFASFFIITCGQEIRRGTRADCSPYSIDVRITNNQVHQNKGIEATVCASICASNNTMMELVSYLGRGVWKACSGCISISRHGYDFDNPSGCSTRTVTVTSMPSQRASRHKLRAVDLIYQDIYGYSIVLEKLGPTSRVSN